LLEITGGKAMSLANISIVGNLVKPPEQMHFSSGRVKTTLVVAVNSYGRPNRGGDAADFYKVETWGKLAELAGQYLVKGNQVAVSGRLLFDRWTDKQGKNRFTPVVEAAQLALPSRLKVVDEQNEGESLEPRQSGSVITGNISCSEDDDPFADSEVLLSGGDVSSSQLSDAADGDTAKKDKSKLLAAKSA
jgi:single-strand DNA-binding protein